MADKDPESRVAGENGVDPAAGVAGGRGPRFWVSALPDAGVLAGGDGGVLIHLDADESRHAARVLRLGAGDGVVLFDGRGGEADGVLASVGKSRVSVQVAAVRRVPEPRAGVVVASALPKGSRAEGMVDQLSQVGVLAWAALKTDRGVVEARGNKAERLQKRALLSGKQCGRAWALRVEAERDLAGVLGAGGAALADRWLVMDTDGPLLNEVLGAAEGDAFPADGSCGIASASNSEGGGLSEGLSGGFSGGGGHCGSGGHCGGGDLSGGWGRVGLLVGPEGGWSDRERSAMAAGGVARFRLPTPVMRTETAALVGAAVVMGWFF